MNLKQLIIRAAARSGAAALVGSSNWRRQRLLILCYHGVSRHDEHEWDPMLYVTQARLRERLQWLRQHRFAVLRLGEALRQLDEGSLPHRAVALTFDDGAGDFADRALPVLREFDAPATLYLTTYYCEHRYPVFDTALGYLLWKGKASGAELSSLVAAAGALTVSSEEDRSRAWHAIYDHARRMSLDAAGKHELLRELASRLQIDFEAFVASGMLQLMTPQQVHDLPGDLIDVQLHTHRHRTPRDREAFTRELLDNQARIAALTDNPAERSHFCYPSGDYDGRFLPWLREIGVKSATTCIPGLASRHANRLLLPRFVDTMAVSTEMFAAWTSGFAEMLPRRAEYRLDLNRLSQA